MSKSGLSPRNFLTIPMDGASPMARTQSIDNESSQLPAVMKKMLTKTFSNKFGIQDVEKMDNQRYGVEEEVEEEEVEEPIMEVTVEQRLTREEQRISHAAPSEYSEIRSYQPASYQPADYYYQSNYYQSHYDEVEAPHSITRTSKTTCNARKIVLFCVVPVAFLIFIAAGVVFWVGLSRKSQSGASSSSSGKADNTNSLTQLNNDELDISSKNFLQSTSSLSRAAGATEIVEGPKRSKVPEQKQQQQISQQQKQKLPIAHQQQSASSIFFANLTALFTNTVYPLLSDLAMFAVTTEFLGGGGPEGVLNRDQKKYETLKTKFIEEILKEWDGSESKMTEMKGEVELLVKETENLKRYVPIRHNVSWVAKTLMEDSSEEKSAESEQEEEQGQGFLSKTQSSSSKTLSQPANELNINAIILQKQISHFHKEFEARKITKNGKAPRSEGSWKEFKGDMKNICVATVEKELTGQSAEELKSNFLCNEFENIPKPSVGRVVPTRTSGRVL